MSLPLITPMSEVRAAIRVMIVDDAVIVRGLMARWLAEERDIEVVGVFRNGRDAVDNVLQTKPDIVILDINMPKLDGLAALPLLLARKPDLVVIMSSTLTRRNAEVSLKALSLGATDYVTKPGTNREVTVSQSFRREIIEKICHLGRRRSRVSLPARTSLLTTELEDVRSPAIATRPFPAMRPRIVAVGSSTGGPQALQVLIRGLAPILSRLPVVIVQHMPPTFTTILAEHLGRTANRPSHEGVHGEILKPGRIYVAPGGKHMKIERHSNALKIALDDGQPVHSCKPAVDPLFISAAAAVGSGLLGVVLTGMGKDGSKGTSVIAAAGGAVIAQDEVSSVVWGMPGASALTGLCSAILPIDDIAPKIVKLIHGDRF
jgi:two-component system chemotaxis response regulator CheB